MQISQKKRVNRDERLLGSFMLWLAKRGFDVKIFDEEKIIKYLGNGWYEAWKKCLGDFHYPKIVICVNEKESKTCWPSDSDLDRLVINLVRLPDIQTLLRGERELRLLEK